MYLPEEISSCNVKKKKNNPEDIFGNSGATPTGHEIIMKKKINWQIISI